MMALNVVSPWFFSQVLFRITSTMFETSLGNEAKHIQKKSVLIPEEDTSIFFLSQFPRFPSSPDRPKPKWSSNLCLFSVTHNDTVPLIGPENESARKILSGHSACRHEYKGLHYTMYDARFYDCLSVFLFPNQLTKPQPMLNTGIDGPSKSTREKRTIF